MSTLTDLRSKIEGLIGDLLGTYTYPDGSTTTALYVGYNVPEGVKVSGLEATILNDPAINPIAMQGEAGSYREWQVILRQHNDDDMLSLTQAVERLVAEWPEMASPVIIPATYETLAQARVSIPQRVLVRRR